VKLTELQPRVGAWVETVEDQGPNDSIARRLRELGFVAGERVEVVASGPFGAEPLLIQVGFTRFALRRSEAARVRLQPQHLQSEHLQPGHAPDEATAV
jgi:ferrous iron transport protein A